MTSPLTTPQHQWKRFSMTLTHCGECPNYQFLCKPQTYGCVKLHKPVSYAGVHPDCKLPDAFEKEEIRTDEP